MSKMFQIILGLALAALLASTSASGSLITVEPNGTNLTWGSSAPNMNASTTSWDGFELSEGQTQTVPLMDIDLWHGTSNCFLVFCSSYTRTSDLEFSLQLVGMNDPVLIPVHMTTHHNGWGTLTGSAVQYNFEPTALELNDGSSLEMALSLDTHDNWGKYHTVSADFTALSTPNEVPEPGALLLMATGLLLMLALAGGKGVTRSRRTTAQQ